MEASSIEYVAYIGLDWADREHAWCLQVAGQSNREKGVVAQTPEAIEQWAAVIAQRFAGRPVAVALEQSRGALLFALTKYEHLILFPIHPARLAHYRKSFRPSGAKDDPTECGTPPRLSVASRRPTTTFTARSGRNPFLAVSG